ncbi:MAG TPA: dihydrodipicolinate synthase family protein [Gemmatimonadaceae bacterium]|nr:dihydrodipicolinate synthase family protein [Gemmatimonadaceae bacterium]
MTLRLGGLLAPVTTPFDAAGELAPTALARNIAAHLAAGVDGIVVTGSTGEAALLDESERLEVMESARSATPSDRLLVAGVGAESTRTTVRLARAAAERGVDAVLVVAPHYYGAAMMSAAALLAHYRRVADESPVPVVLYNIPKYMHFRLAPQLVAELSAHGNVVGIKDSSGDVELLSVYLNYQHDHFAVLTGSAQLLQTALESSARGGVLAVSTFAAPVARAVMEAVARGDRADATEAQARLTPLAATIVGELGVPGIKAALDLVGLAGGAPRMPLQRLGQEQRRTVAELLRGAELPLVA